MTTESNFTNGRLNLVLHEEIRDSQMHLHTTKYGFHLLGHALTLETHFQTTKIVMLEFKMKGLIGTFSLVALQDVDYVVTHKKKYLLF